MDDGTSKLLIDVVANTLNQQSIVLNEVKNTASRTEVAVLSSKDELREAATEIHDTAEVLADRTDVINDMHEKINKLPVVVIDPAKIDTLVAFASAATPVINTLRHPAAKILAVITVIITLISFVEFVDRWVPILPSRHKPATMQQPAAPAAPAFNLAP